jgi:iron-sulfur cluster repair protein YtfE (RIC family)
MEASQATTQLTPCDSPLPELEVPMITALVRCLGSEHKRLDELNMQLVFAATTLAADPQGVAAGQRLFQIWEEIRRDLWSHLQIEDGLVFGWGGAHHAISSALLDVLKTEHEEMRKSVAVLPTLSPGADGNPQTDRDRAAFAQTLLAFSRTFDSHVERYESKVLPSILRAVFHNRGSGGSA